MLQIGNITFDCDKPEQLAGFWAKAIGYEIASTSPYFAELKPAGDGAGPHLLLIKVPESKSVKNRVHLDLHADDRAAEVRRLVALGAMEHQTFNEWGVNWTVLQDPEGNELCIGTPSV